MKASTYISSFYIAKLAQAISSSYTSLEAYRAGSIDENGNIIKPESSIDPFEYLVIKLKKIFDQLPYGTTKAQLSNYMATLNLFTEEANPELQMFLEGVITSLEINEDTVAGGGGAGTLGTPASPSVSTGGVAGFDPVMAVGLKRKKPTKYFNDCEIFDVCPEEWMSFKSAKQWKDIPDSETKTYLQRFQRRNKNAKMAVRSLNPISGNQDLYWITYPSKNFLGEGNSDPIEIMANNVINPPKQDFDKNGKPIKGAAIERMGRLILGAESERTATQIGSKSLLKHVMDTLAKVAGKPISNNQTDSYHLNPETLEMEPKDVKSHDTSLGGRINVEDYPQHPGLQAAMEPIRQTLRDVESDPEKVEKVKAETRKALSNLTTQSKDSLKDLALQNLSPENILVLRGENKSKPSKFPFLSNFLPRKKVEGLLGQSEFKYGLRTQPGRAEVAIRTSPDFPTQKAQTIMAKDTQTGKITNAEMHPDTLQTILKRVSPKLQDIMRQTLEPFVRK